MMFSECENTNLKEKNDKFGDMQVVHWLLTHGPIWLQGAPWSLKRPISLDLEAQAALGAHWLFI